MSREIEDIWKESVGLCRWQKWREKGSDTRGTGAQLNVSSEFSLIFEPLKSKVGDRHERLMPSIACKAIASPRANIPGLFCWSSVPWLPPSVRSHPSSIASKNLFIPPIKLSSLPLIFYLSAHYWEDFWFRSVENKAKCSAMQRVTE